MAEKHQHKKQFMNGLRFYWGELTATFWFIPTLIITLAALGAWLGIYLDTRLDYQPSGVALYLFSSSADSARSVLSVIAGAMIGVAGTVFSITLVTLTLASSQFGSRLLRNFMHERINQVVLGSYIATYVYCLIVLSVIKSNDLILFVPNVSVALAIGAAIVNIILLVFFIHHVAVSIQSDKVIADISETLSKNINYLFSEEIGEESVAVEKPDLQQLRKRYATHQAFLAPHTGYVQYIDGNRFFTVMEEENALVILHKRPGSYIVKGMVVADIYCHEALSDESLQKLESALTAGKVRTPRQDAEFAIHQVVEIAARALSPGVNDPYTAIACIDNLTATMCHLTGVKFPARYRYNDDGQLRVVADVLTFKGMLDASFNQIRQFATGSPAVVIRLMEALITIHPFARYHEQKPAVEHHAEMILRLAEQSFTDHNDLDDMKKRSRLIIDPAG